MRVRSSSPSSPPSPAWGFSAATAMRGRSFPSARSSRASQYVLTDTASGVTAAGTAASARCVVTSAVVSSLDENAITRCV